MEVRLRRDGPVVTVEDNYDRLGYDADAVACDSRYVRDTCMLRAHVMVPPALRQLASEPRRPSDVLFACPGIVYRRDAVDRLHTGTPHQLDLGRVVSRPMMPADLRAMVEVVVRTLLPGRRRRAVAATHPYTLAGLQIDVADDDGRWVEIGERGLAEPRALRGAGLGTRRWSGLATGLDLSPYRPVYGHPAAVRDLSIACAPGTTAEDLGERVRERLGGDSPGGGAVEILSCTPASDVPPAAAARLGIGPGWVNPLPRVTLRRVHRTITGDEADDLRDRVYGALHEADTVLAAP